jgi:hypothetical protein
LVKENDGYQQLVFELWYWMMALVTELKMLLETKKEKFGSRMNVLLKNERKKKSEVVKNNFSRDTRFSSTFYYNFEQRRVKHKSVVEQYEIRLL